MQSEGDREGLPVRAAGFTAEGQKGLGRQQAPGEALQPHCPKQQPQAPRAADIYINSSEAKTKHPTSGIPGGPMVRMVFFLSCWEPGSIPGLGTGILQAAQCS